MMQTTHKRNRIRSIFDHILIGMVIVFGTMTVTLASTNPKIMAKIQSVFRH